MVHTRPKIDFVVNKLCQYLQNPTTVHWAATKRILRYLKGALNYGLTFTPLSQFDIISFTDADRVGSVDDRRSTGGYAIYYGKNLVSWLAKKQPTVARSSTEAEFQTIADAATEIIWIRNLLQEIGFPIARSSQILTDNLGSKFLAYNPLFH